LLSQDPALTMRASGSVDDLATGFVAKHRESLMPAGQNLLAEPRPVEDLANDDDRGAASIRPGWVAGKLSVCDIRVVLEWAGRQDLVYARGPVPDGQFGGQSSAVRDRCEIDVIHHDLWPIVRMEASGELFAGLEIGLGSVEERS
jgi:hypothetical protein